jgi:uncharacterized small protein (DUF1192 family)
MNELRYSHIKWIADHGHFPGPVEQNTAQSVAIDCVAEIEQQSNRIAELTSWIENLKAELMGAERLAAWRLTECDTLEKDLRQLTAWKENAISRYPELGEEGE